MKNVGGGDPYFMDGEVLVYLRFEINPPSVIPYISSSLLSILPLYVYITFPSSLRS